ncbi:amidase [Amycolatopsis sp.]|uniref:amidase n=1 Tax=Amycolatopsis sp. TaxID=37632 RepID=UPI002B769D49|nr:amidase [Amycolatopsis sp.]HVV09867.1 amidase [Amycolatopsis sp.]
MTELPKTLTDAAKALREGTVTSVALTEAAIAAADASDETIGTYLARFDEYALERAALADAELASGKDLGPLHGIPFGVKDILAMAEGPTTAQSLILDRSWGAGKDAPTVARVKAAGAVITGKTTTMEFACGMPDEAKPFPIPRNPWNPETWPGGSSSGTGSGVAAGMFLAGLGTDTAGSIRIPAAFCGVSGLMPTFGRVPKSGCVPLGYSLDHVGPLARGVRDCASVLEVLAGPDASDPDCVDAPFTAPEFTGDLTGLRIGVVREHHFPEGGDPAVEGTFDAAVAVLAERGASVIEVELPYWQEMITADMITMGCEALAYHRGDLSRRWDDYFVATRAMIATGAMVSGADYVQAQRMRRVAQDAIGRLFETVDVIASPTASVGAPAFQTLLGPNGETDVSTLFSYIHTPYWDSVGNPVLVVPMGFTGDGMPLSLQLAGPAFGEAAILRAGDAFQQSTDWHLRVPEPAVPAAV